MYSTYIFGRYTNAEDLGRLVSKGAYIRLGLNLIPSIIMIIFRNELTKNKIEKRVFITFSLVNIFAIFFVNEFSVVVDRIVLYMAIIQIFVLTRLSYIFKHNSTIKFFNFAIVSF